jgi:sugar phosphate isomerase/epimerase
VKACAASICWVNDTLDAALQKARQCGSPAIELLTFPVEIWDVHGDLRKMKPSDLKHRVEDNGLELAALHLGAILTPTEEMTRTLTDYTKLAIEFAQRIGCGTIVTGGPLRETQPFEPFMESLQELLPCLEDSGVRIGLENHYLNWLQYIDDYDRLFESIDSPSIGMTLDTGHFTSAGVDPVEVARRFAHRVYHVHIKDHIGTQSVALGAGQTDNFGVARALKEAGYSGYLSQELEVSDPENSDRYASEGLDYIRRLCAT